MLEFKAQSVAGESGQTNVSVILKDGDEEISKVISLASFISLFKKGGIPVVRESSCHIGRLPEGYVDAKFASDNTFEVIVERPPAKRVFLYNAGAKKEKYELPFPRLVFVFKMHKGSLVAKRVFAAKTDANLYDACTVLARYPFGNVYSGGDICFGNINLADINHMADVDRVVEYFLSGYTSNDLYNSDNTTQGCSQKDLITLLEKRQSFPDKWLSPSIITMGNIWDIEDED